MGANDVANSLNTAVGTGSIKIYSVLIIGTVMNFFGSVLFGSTLIIKFTRRRHHRNLHVNGPNQLHYGNSGSAGLLDHVNFCSLPSYHLSYYVRILPIMIFLVNLCNTIRHDGFPLVLNHRFRIHYKYAIYSPRFHQSPSFYYSIQIILQIFKPLFSTSHLHQT